MTDIRLHSVSKSYGGHSVLHDVDLAVPDGAVLALLGPSGCGKTTLLRLIAGFERSDAGKISLGPVLVESGGSFVPPEHRHIGYVPQEGALFPHLTAAGNIAFGLRNRKERTKRVQEMLDLIGLGGHAEKFPHELSGGQQQRIALARALAPNPRVMLLDEPFNALDLGLRRRMSEEVVGLLREAGTTTILVTHDPAEAFAAADLVAVMKDGTIMQCGKPADLYRSPASIDVARLTGGAIFLDGILRNGAAETALGLLPADGDAAAENSKVTVLLRPEQLRLTSSGNGRSALIVRSRFKGDHSVVTVDIGGLSLDIRTQDVPCGRSALVQVEGKCRFFRAGK
jgi:iron(III) transport system ATP-binding protein